MSTSSLAERSLAAVWHPCTPMKRHEHEPLLAIDRAEELGCTTRKAIVIWMRSAHGGSICLGTAIRISAKHSRSN